LYGGCGVREDQGRGEKMEVMWGMNKNTFPIF
jgi:hypothetical protein